MLETFHQILRTCLPQQKLCYADFFKVAPKVNDGKLSSTVGTLLHTAFSQIQNNSKIWRILYLSVISDTCLSLATQWQCSMMIQKAADCRY